MPPTFKELVSSSTPLELKFYQRLWIRFFIQTRKLMAGKINTQYYGDVAAYEKVENVLLPLEDKTPTFGFDATSLSNETLNEFAMESAYRLAQIAHTRPDPFHGYHDSPILTQLAPIQGDLFDGGEAPPHNLPAESVSEIQWRDLISFTEGQIWLDFLIFIINTKFKEGSSTDLALVIMFYISLLDKGSPSEIYERVPGPADLEDFQNRLRKERPDFKGIDSLEELRSFTSKLSASTSMWIARRTVEVVTDRLLVSQDRVNERLANEHELWIEEFFHTASRSLQACERSLSNDLKTKSVDWEVVVAMKSSIDSSKACLGLGFKIVSESPVSWFSAAPGVLFAHFSGIPAHHPEAAVSVARRRLHSFLDVLTYHAGWPIDAEILGESFCRSQFRADWVSMKKNGEYPSRFFEPVAIDRCDDVAAKLMDLSESNDLARRVLEALRLNRLAKESFDLQHQYTCYWLSIDLFLQNSNSPEKELPLYQLMYATKADPVPGDSKYVPFQMDRLEKFKKDTEVFWKIRNAGSVHHGKYPRWEDRSLRLWGQRLEEVAVRVLRYNMGVVLATPPLHSVGECLKDIRTTLFKQGVLQNI